MKKTNNYPEKQFILAFTILKLLCLFIFPVISYSQIIGVPGTGNGNLMISGIAIENITETKTETYESTFQMMESFKAKHIWTVYSEMDDMPKMKQSDGRVAHSQYEINPVAEEVSAIRTELLEFLNRGATANTESKLDSFIENKVILLSRLEDEGFVKAENCNYKWTLIIEEEKEEPESSLPQLGLNVDTKNMTISANTQYVFKPKQEYSKNRFFLGFGARVAASQDFSNIFSNGDIS